MTFLPLSPSSSCRSQNCKKTRVEKEIDSRITHLERESDILYKSKERNVRVFHLMSVANMGRLRLEWVSIDNMGWLWWSVFDHRQHRCSRFSTGLTSMKEKGNYIVCKNINWTSWTFFFLYIWIENSLIFYYIFVN